MTAVKLTSVFQWDESEPELMKVMVLADVMIQIPITPLEKKVTMTDKPVPCILESIDSLGEYSCFARDYDLWCPFATIAGLERYGCRSGNGTKP